MKIRIFGEVSGAVRNADRMNQRRVRMLPRSESRRGAYTAKPDLPGLGKTRVTDLNTETSSNRAYRAWGVQNRAKNRKLNDPAFSTEPFNFQIV